MKRTFIILFVCCLLLQTGCVCKHKWKEATCTEPRTCEKCGETKGEPLGHVWKEATCTEPRTCERCGEKQGEALGHAWKEATCTEPAVCERCGEKQGEALGHDAAWTVKDRDVIAARQTMAQTCARCGEELDTAEEDITTFVEDKHFIFTGEEYTARVQNIWNDKKKDSFELRFTYSVDKKGRINFDFYNRNDVWLGWGVFYDKDDNTIDAATANDVPICSIRIFAAAAADGIDEEALVFLFLQLIGPCACAADPSIPDVNTYLEPISENLYDRRSGKNLNGLTYSCGYNGDDKVVYLDIEIPQ